MKKHPYVISELIAHGVKVMYEVTKRCAQHARRSMMPANDEFSHAVASHNCGVQDAEKIKFEKFGAIRLFLKQPIPRVTMKKVSEQKAEQIVACGRNAAHGDDAAPRQRDSASGVGFREEVQVRSLVEVLDRLAAFLLCVSERLHGSLSGVPGCPLRRAICANFSTLTSFFSKNLRKNGRVFFEVDLFSTNYPLQQSSQKNEEMVLSK